MKSKKKSLPVFWHVFHIMFSNDFFLFYFYDWAFMHKSCVFNGFVNTFSSCFACVCVPLVCANETQLILNLSCCSLMRLALMVAMLDETVRPWWWISSVAWQAWWWISSRSTTMFCHVFCSHFPDGTSGDMLSFIAHLLTNTAGGTANQSRSAKHHIIHKQIIRCVDSS